LAKHIDESAYKVRTLNAELGKEKDRYSEAMTALSGLGDKKLLDAKTTAELVRLYPELSGKITAYRDTVESAARAVEELNKQKT
jgi:predicted component of type VI protein secretion system